MNFAMTPTDTFTAISTTVSVLALAMSAYSMKKTIDFRAIHEKV